jgi:hypothetical protein
VAVKQKADMMTDAQQPSSPPPTSEDARDLQARLYREIGISAVAAALRFTTQADPLPWVLRDDTIAA